DRYTLGSAYVNDFLYGEDPNLVFIFSDNFFDVEEIGNTLSHEVGHTVGLRHFWQDHDNDGQFDNGENTNPSAIMSTPDYGLNRETWSFGYASENTEITQDQDDAAILAGSLGHRNDNQGGDSRSTAPALTLHTNGSLTFTDVIEELNDIDYVSVDVSYAGPGTLRIDIDPLADNLDVVLSLYDSISGSALMRVAPDDSYSAILQTSFTPGCYYIGISSDGEPGEMGRYTLTGDLPTETAPQVQGFDLSEDTGNSDTDKVTRDTTPTLTVQFSQYVWGSAQDIQLIDPQGRNVALGAVNGWGSEILTFAPAQPLSFNGTYQVVLKRTIHGQGGLQLDSGTDYVSTFVLDTTAPTVTIRTLTTTDTTPALSGTVNDPQADVVVTVNGRSYNAVNQGNGTWVLTDNAMGSALAIGTYDVSVQATDLAGNSASDNSLDELTIQSGWGLIFGPMGGLPSSPIITLPSNPFTFTFTFTFPSLGGAWNFDWPF
ncbi:Ig-like domain-containing protein, partial [Planctomycetota bacterium]